MRWFSSRFMVLKSTTFIYARHHSSASPSVSVYLRPYQKQCLDACMKALNRGHTRIGVSLPTGSGKTTVFITLLSCIVPSSPQANRALIVVNSVELARQSADQVRTLFPDWTVEIEQGSQHKASGLADVTVATYQTLLRGERLKKFDKQYLKAVIVDEAHHAAAPSYRSLLSYFDPAIRAPDKTSRSPTSPSSPSVPAPTITSADKPLQPLSPSSPSIPIIGFSATFSRHDSLALGSVFERIVYHRDFLAMIKEQWLCDVRFTCVRAKFNLDQATISLRTGDFNPASLAHAINTDTFNNLVVQTWLDRASARKSTLVFCVDVSHVRALTQTFRSFGVDARYVYAQTPLQERKDLIASFKAGLFPVLVNCAILTEGADIPNIDCVVVARPTRSQNLFAQMIGRGMRLSPNTGKTDCRIIDFVDSTASVPGIVSSPTLFGLDPDKVDIQDESLENMEAHQVKLVSSASDTDNLIPKPESVTYTDYDNPFALVEDSSGAPNIIAISPNAWVGCGGDIYVLECLGRGHIRIEPVPATKEEEFHYKASYTPASMNKLTAIQFRVSPYFSPRPILKAPTLSKAIRGAETYVRMRVLSGSYLMAGLLRSARWRKHPATPDQKELVARKWRNYADDSSGKSLEERLANLTKGEAANVITRLKHGALRRYNEKMRAEKKKVQIESKERLRRSREVVKVGPLHDPGEEQRDQHERNRRSREAAKVDPLHELSFDELDQYARTRRIREAVQAEDELHDDWDDDPVDYEHEYEYESIQY
ncbi:hypothetical protein HGRIS_007976 [Hohenbuehelia grisea]|uniref:P-loop containing nucleoside triphosphate hydrolase protein n=1 Tax=Hohenbuehelia grisea TaxID=104357 RepID=A0ABR3J6K3_9AGAR